MQNRLVPKEFVVRGPIVLAGSAAAKIRAMNASSKALAKQFQALGFAASARQAFVNSYIRLIQHAPNYPWR